MNQIKLIVSDLDGTLLLNGRSVPEDHTLSLIKKLTAKGVIFAVASGRQYENLLTLFDKIKDDITYICCNGALCVHHGEIIYENFIDRALAHEIIRDIESTVDSRAMVSAKGYEAISDKDEHFYRYMIDFVKAKTVRMSNLCSVKEEIFKVSLYNEKGDLNASYWEEKYKGRCEVLTSGSVWLDFIPFFSDKGTAVKKLMEHKEIGRENTIAFGDNDNDLSMLKTAGTAVTMCSAREEIRRHGDFSTPTVDEVLERILDHLSF